MRAEISTFSSHAVQFMGQKPTKNQQPPLALKMAFPSPWKNA